MNTKKNLARQYIWLFLLGITLQTASNSLLCLAPDGPAWHFMGGVMAGLACVALGAFIYLAAATARKGPSNESEAHP